MYTNVSEATKIHSITKSINKVYSFQIHTYLPNWKAARVLFLSFLVCSIMREPAGGSIDLLSVYSHTALPSSDCTMKTCWK